MRLNAPKMITWVIALIVGAVGALIHLFMPTLITVPFGLGFWLLLVGFVLLLLATALKGL
jgi:hypothetical protein